MKLTPLILSGLCLLLGAHTLMAQVTYRVYATRIGLVGETTANGHVVQPNDHFVALPSTSALSPKNGYAYTVNLSNPANGKSVANVPVWDVGPWNCHDNYWSADRDPLIDPPLPRGLPQAEAAWFEGHNDGYDFSPSCSPNHQPRQVLNPAGIDLADGTFWDSLGMTGNGWIDVTFNWERPDGIVVDNADPGFSASGNWQNATWASDKFGANYRWRSTQSVSDAAKWEFSVETRGDYEVFAWWSAASNRATAAPYIVDHANGSTTVHRDQTKNGGKWNSLGTFRFGGANPRTHSVRLSCWTNSGDVVIADAILLVPKVVWVDNHHSGFAASSSWSTSTWASDKYGPDYRYRNTQATSDAATWTVQHLASGEYRVQAWWAAGANRATSAPYIVHHLDGSEVKHANQTLNGGQWNNLGNWLLSGGENSVQLSCWTSSGDIVIADAVRWRKQ